MNERQTTCPTHGYFHDAAYCPQCGTKLGRAPTCACGVELSRFDKFCRKCGKANVDAV